MKPFRSRIVQSLMASLLASCAAWPTGSGHIDPSPEPVVPVLLEERMPTVTSVSSQEESRAVGIAGDERPETCFGTDQPAVVRVQANDAGTRSPIWMCRDGCAPGFELVTSVSTGTRRRHPGQYWYFQPSCEPICEPTTHRSSYLVDGSATASSTCVPGPPSANTLDSQRRENDRRVAAVLRRWNEDLGAIERLVVAAEGGRSPWADETLKAFHDADERLHEIEGGLRSWFKKAPSVARLAESYKGVDDELATSARTAFLTRIQRGLSPDVKDRVNALRARLDGVRPRAKQAVAERETAAAQASTAEQLATDSRIRALCAGDCERAYQSCLERCRRLTAGVCASCASVRSGCRLGCGVR